MEQSYQDRNAAGLERLRALVRRLGDQELAHELEGGWTVGSALAHLAFWDRFLAARWVHAARENLRVPAEMDDFVADLINDASLEAWRACPPRLAAAQALAAAERVAQLIAGLDTEQAAAAFAGGRDALADRGRHWSEHIDQIEIALSR